MFTGSIIRQHGVVVFFFFNGNVAGLLMKRASRAGDKSRACALSTTCCLPLLAVFKSLSKCETFKGRRTRNRTLARRIMAMTLTLKGAEHKKK